ncbi:hypothetical protein B0H16DRAFT_1270524, partial [Mycena metata]
VPNSSQTFVFRAYDDPAPPKHAQGSFPYDLASGKYKMRWDSFEDFEEWFQEEQNSRVIQFRLIKTYSNAPVFDRQLRYSCSRGGTGGQKSYTKLHPEWRRKCEPRRTGCDCTLNVKQYPGIATVLGNYKDQHNHELGNANLRFMSISKETREYIAGLLRMKVL